MKTLYLVAAILGAILPYVFFTPLITSGAPLSVWVGQLYGTPAAGGFATDLFITSGVFWWWSWDEARTRGMKRWWAYVLVNLFIGLSCAFPLFLFFRARAAER